MQSGKLRICEKRPCLNLRALIMERDITFSMAAMPGVEWLPITLPVCVILSVTTSQIYINPEDMWQRVATSPPGHSGCLKATDDRLWPHVRTVVERRVPALVEARLGADLVFFCGLCVDEGLG